MPEPAVPTAEYDTDRLTLFARHKRDCLAQLHALGGAQAGLIATGETTQLLSVLAAKQRLLAALLDIERNLDPFREQPAESRTWRDEATRADCGALLAECETLFRDILQQEKLAEEQLGRLRDETAARLQDVRSADQARRAYASDAPLASSLDLHTTS